MNLKLVNNDGSFLGSVGERVVSGADVSDENRVGNSLLQILKLRFGQKAKLLFGI